MKDDTVAGVVVALVLVLGDGAGPNLKHLHKKKREKDIKSQDLLSYYLKKHNIRG